MFIQENERDLSRIDKKLFVYFGLLIFALLITVFLTTLFYFNFIMQKEQNRLGSIIANSVGNAINRVSFSGKYQARLLVHDLKKENKNIDSIIIQNNYGLVIAHSTSKYQGRILNDKLFQEAKNATKNGKYFVKNVTISRDNKKIKLLEIDIPYKKGYENRISGVTRVFLSKESLNRLITNAFFYLSFLITFLALFSYFVVKSLSAKISAPIIEQKQFFEHLLHIIPLPVYYKDVEGRYIGFNQAFEKFIGKKREDILGRDVFAIFEPKLAKLYQDKDRELFEKDSVQIYETILKDAEGKNSNVILNKASIVDAKDNIKGLIGVILDITERKQYERQLERIAHYDILTGLPNRILNSDRLRQAMHQVARRGEQIAVLYLDLDGFKEVNDRYGHSIGDKLLRMLSYKMKQTLREGDTLSRLGGDEFVAIIVDINNRSIALPIIQRLLKIVSHEMKIDDISVRVSVSIGATFFPQQDNVDADQLIRQADQAMYEAKQSGKNCYKIFNPEQDRTIRKRHEDIENIRKALENQELILHYQPKINMRTGELIGAEALIRWQHPKLGLIPPLEFLPLIEDHPLAIKIGEWVINKVITQIRLWQSQGLDLLVSVNVGAKQLLQSDFVQRLQWIISQHEDFDPTLLQIEILETSALENIEQAAYIIESCKDIGVHFALDDFGTGYSSLTYLKRLPVTTLKIDKSFIQDMLDNQDDLAILQGIISLASAFGREVIAEGVETHKHGKQLLSLGCELAQGYGIARPMPDEKMIEWAKKWKTDHRWIS